MTSANVSCPVRARRPGRRSPAWVTAGAAIAVLLSSAAPAAEVEIWLARDTGKEVAARAQLQRLLQVYDLERWLFTRKILVDESQHIPHSHPVLTVSPRYLDDDHAQLATLLHEQLHWFEEQNPVPVKKAIEAFRELFPEVPSGREGARDDYSTYLHLVVCDLELQALSELIGEAAARETLAGWNHYTWIYEQVLENPRVRRINEEHGLVAARLTAPDRARPTVTSIPASDWFQDHVEALTAGGGSWLTSNEAYQGEQEPFEAFRIVWRKGIGGRSVYGRMTGVIEGESTPPLWEFRIYWDPARGEPRIMQFSGAGIFGDGAIEVKADGSDISIQTFHPPGDEPFRIRHVSRLRGDVHETASYREDGTGNWDLNREYTWHREKGPA